MATLRVSQDFFLDDLKSSIFMPNKIKMPFAMGITKIKLAWFHLAWALIPIILPTARAITLHFKLKYLISNI